MSPVLLAIPRLAGRLPDEVRHLLERLVLLLAKHHGAPDRRVRHLAGGGNTTGGVTAKVFAPIDRRRLRGNGPGGQGRTCSALP